MGVFLTDLVGVRVPPTGRAGFGWVGVGSVADSRFSQQKAPLASWVTFGAQIDMKRSSFRPKRERNEQSVADFL